MVRLNEDIVEFPNKKGGQTAVQDAVFQTSQLQEEPLVEQHFGGLSDHFADDTLEGFAARTTQCIRDFPWSAALASLAFGLLLGMLTAPAPAKPVKALRNRLSRKSSAEGFDLSSTLDDNLSAS